MPNVSQEQFDAYTIESKEHRLRLESKLDEILKDGKENLIQSIKTTGRVTALEKSTQEHSIAIEAFQELRWWVKGAFWLWCVLAPAFLVGAPIVASYYIRSIAHDEAVDAISEALEKYEIPNE